ncbi:MAG: methyl-accepting chemotaxis protein, partial [Hyphomicrobiales bacterium]
DIMGEISAASSEQSAGVGQVGEAITQMDQTTQQNAALVEESAAAASSLKAQAGQLVDAVAVFRTAQDGRVHRGAAMHAPAAPAVRAAVVTPRTTAFATPQRSAAPVMRPAAAPPTPALAPVAPPSVSVKAKGSSGGANDDWESF